MRTTRRRISASSWATALPHRRIWLVKRGLARHPFSDTQEDIEARFRLMEDAGVGRQVLSPNHPPYLPDETECVTAVKMLNDAYAEFARRYPDRISSM